MKQHTQAASKSRANPVTPAPDTPAPAAATVQPGARGSRTRPRHPLPPCDQHDSAARGDTRSGIADQNADTPAPPCCPLCGVPLRFFSLVPSAVLDWCAGLDADLATLRTHLHDLKAAVASSVLP